ncbi:MAG TPA: efflux RND transporter permease subunit [Bryobacteraceae bacterium]|nr:efflux RND transporter permease subunit [Bryobacteraceae bacterium]
MNPVRGSLRHTQVTIALTAVLCGAGLYALAKMPRREDPKITIRTGLVSALYPGATAEQVEKQVAVKIEERLFRYAEVRKDRTFSTSRPNIVIINVELEDWVKNPDTFWSKLRHDMNQLRATELPEAVRGPVVDSDFGDTVAVLLSIRGSRYGYRELKEYSQRIEESLRTLRAVAKIRRVGEQQEDIRITSSLERLSQYAVNPVKIIQALQGRNAVQYAGTLDTEQGSVQLNPNGAFQTEDQIRRVIIDVSPLTGQPVHIGDIAHVERSYRDIEFATRFNGEPAIMLAVEMQEGRNIVEFGDALRKKVEEVKLILPPDLSIDFVADQPRVVGDRISHFIREFGIAIISVVLVTILLLPLRVALIAALAIPATVATSFGLMNVFGIELHQVSIAALIVVLGMVVDDAIVIADNYVDLLDRGMPIAEAAWRSASDLAVPVLTATLTIVASFLPLLMLSGAVGEFIRALPLTVAIALLSSFAVAMLVTPLLARFFIKKGLHEDGATTKRGFNPLAVMQRSYGLTIRWAMRHKSLAVAGAVLVFIGGVGLLRFVPRQFFPSAERNQFVIDVYTPEGTRIEATDQVTRRIESHLRGVPLVRDFSTFLGGSAPRFYYNVNPQQPASNYAQVLVNTRAEKGTPELAHELRDRLARIAPEARVIVRELQQGNVMEAPVEVRVSGDDLGTLKALGQQVEGIVNRTPGAVYTHTDFHEDRWQLRIDVKEEVANRLGLSNANIARQLAGSFEGLPVTTFWEGGRAVDVTLRVDEDRRRSFENVQNAYVTSLLTGARTPVRAVADLWPEWDSGRIVRRNGVRTLTVRTFPDEHHLASQVLAAARPRIDGMALPAGYRIEYGGELERQAETFSEMVRALVVSVAAIFLILLFQFRAIPQSLVVMASIPLAFPGAVLGLLVTNNPFGFTAFMGIVSLGGVVVRNAIILVDYIEERLRGGAALEQAALEAGERRLRPIFLTTMAAAVGVTPMIISGSSLWSPLASVIAVGLLVSTLFTLVAVPVIYVLVMRRTFRAPAVAGALLAALVLAPNMGAEPRRITLEEAVDLATKNNAVVKLASLKVGEAQAREAQARSHYFPQLSNESNYYNIVEKQRLEIPRGALGVSPQAGPIPVNAVTIFQGGRSLGLLQTSVGQPLTQLFRIREGHAVARADTAIAETNVERARNEIAAKVKELYYTLLGLEARRKAAQAAITAAEERLKEGRDAVETGAALQVRAMQARASSLEARQANLTLDIQIDDATLEFNELLGLPLDTQPQLVRDEKPAAVPTSAESYVRTAVERNPEVIAAEQTVDKARHGLGAAKAERIPEIGAFAQHIYQSGVPFLARNNGVVGLRMTWNIFDGGRREGLIRERETQVAQAEEELRRIRRRAEIDVEKAFRRVQRVHNLTIVAREALALRREALRISGDQLELGLGTRAAYEESNAAAAAADADLLAAEYQVQVALAELQRLAGMRHVVVATGGAAEQK